MHLVGFVIRIRALNLVSNHLHSGPLNLKISKIICSLCVSISLPFCIKSGVRDEGKYKG